MRRTRAWPWLFALLTGACGAIEVPEVGNCALDSQCPEGQGCVQAYCVVLGPNQVELAARIRPPASSGLVEQQMPTLALDLGPVKVVRLLPSALLRGTVREVGNAASNIPGQVSLSAPGDIVGLTYRFETTSLDGLAADAEYGFEVRVLPERTYDLTFWPKSPQIPPASFVVAPADLAAGTLDLRVNGAETSKLLAVLVRMDDDTPIEGARVIPLNESGTSGNPVFTSQTGYVEVPVALECEKVRLLVSAPEAGPLFPDILAPPPLADGRAAYYEAAYAPAAGPRDRDPVAKAPIEIAIPKPAPGDEFWAKVRVVDAMGQPVPSIHVQVQGTFEAGGTLERQLTTDDDGTATFTALAGSYQCLVWMPPGEPLASWSGLAKVLSPAEPVWTIPLAPRPRLSGQVVDQAGNPVAGGTLYGRRQPGPRTGNDLAAAEPVLSTPIAGDGSFEMLVDPGTYDLRVVPDAATGQPPLLALATVLEDAEVVLTLEPPGLVALVLEDPSGLAVVDAKVEIFLLEGDAARRLTEGVTDTRGGLVLPVPFVP